MADYFETMRSWRAIETPTVPERTPLETDVDTAYDEYIGNLEKSTSDLSDDNVMKDVLDSFLASRGEDPQSLSLPTPEKRLGLYKTLALKPPPPSEGTLTLGSRSWYNDPEEGYNLLAPPMTYEEFLKRRYGLDLVDLFAGPPEPRTTPPDQPNLPVVTDDNWGQGLVTPEMQRQNPVWRFLQDTYPGQHTKTGLVEYTIDDEAAISLVPTSPKTLKIDSLRALEKNTGAGTRALNLLSQQADKHGVSLEGLIHKFEEEGLSKADLLKFYQKAGWELRYPDKVRRSLSEGKAIEDIRVEVIRAPRPPDQPNLPALLGPPEEPGKKPSSKGRMVRGIGSLMRRRIFPLIQAAQMGYDLLPEDKKFAGDNIDYLKETKPHELFGMDTSGLDYFRDLLGMKQSEPPQETGPLPVVPAKENLRTVVESNTIGGRVSGDETVSIDSLFGDISPSKRAQDTVTDIMSQMSGPEGYVERLIVDQDGNVIEGAHRLEALRRLGISEVPITRIVDPTANLDLSSMRKAIEGAGKIHSDHVNQIMSQVGDMLESTGNDPEKVFEEFTFPEGYEKYFGAALDSVADKPLPKAAGGFVDKPLYDDARVGGLI